MRMCNGVMTYSNGKPLTACMDNVLASRLGSVFKAVQSNGRDGVGDSIDAGLILRRLLEEEGFSVTEKAVYGARVVNEILELQARNEQLMEAVAFTADRNTTNIIEMAIAVERARKALSNQPTNLYQKRQAVIDAAMTWFDDEGLSQWIDKVESAVRDLKTEMGEK